MNCKYFGECGSCTIYGIDYIDELLEKKDRVLSLLSPFGVDELEVFSANESHYRARSEFRIWHNGEVASYAMGNIDKNGVVSIDECPKVVNSIYKRMTPLIEYINSSDLLKKRLFSIEFLATTTDECLVTMIYHKKLDESWQKEAKVLEGKLDCYIIGRSRKQKVVLTQEFVTQKLSIDNQEYLYRYYENSFTQPNPAINVKMIEWAIKHSTRVGEGDFLESYCGLGNFTIPISKYFDKVLATEISKKSIHSAKENCILNGIENIEFVRLSSEEMTQALNREREFRRLEGIELDSYNFSTVLVDPPRAGLDSDTINLISNIPNIIYISCNPDTLYRDLEVLTQTHTIKDSAIFDQFPHTHHIESGVFLQR
ncbi:MAG: tRNA (uridine(54)-C5)-methyltransferase TrmA [Epsilonproteobacteria bacterium]|nr:tRNA (uridine(54)-C5)-methyltransferase TrmA [Campylobacterota bacterium]